MCEIIHEFGRLCMKVYEYFGLLAAVSRSPAFLSPI